MEKRFGAMRSGEAGGVLGPPCDSAEEKEETDARAGGLEGVEEEEEEEEERAKMLRPNDFFALQEGAEEETEPARERELIVE
jgi:hypothetical protein